MFEGVQEASLHRLLHADHLTCQRGKTATEALLTHTRPTSPLTQQGIWQRSAQMSAEQLEHTARYKKSDWEHVWRIYGTPLSPGRVFLLFLFSQSSAAKPGNCTSCACLVVHFGLLMPKRLPARTLMPKRLPALLPRRQPGLCAHKSAWNEEWKLQSYTPTNPLAQAAATVSQHKRCLLSPSPCPSPLTFWEFLDEVEVQVLCREFGGSDSPVAIKDSEVRDA